jgi:hypothetical protein
MEENMLAPDLNTMNLLLGALAGMLAGLLMGLISEVCYRLAVFKSSLLLVDGSFFARSLGMKKSTVLAYGTGIPIHVLTSGVFGMVYVLVAAQFKVNIFSAATVALYFFILWIAMLFTALPIAGQGVMGKKAGRWTWLEQLILHIIYGIGYFVALKLLF